MPLKEEVIIDTSVTNAKKTESDLEGVADATNKANDASEEYGDTLEENTKELEIFGVSIGGMITGFKSSVGAIANSVRSLKLFKVALASTGIGLLVIALGSLVKWLQSTQEGLDFISDAFTTVKAVIDAIIGTLTKFGEAIAKIFSGDVKEGFSDLGAALTGIGDAISENIRLQLEFNQLVRDNEAFNRNNIIHLANLRQEMSKNRLIAQDEQAGLEAQVAAQKEIVRITEAITKLEFDSAQAHANQISQRIENERAAKGITGALLDDEIEEIFVAQAAAIDVRTAANNKIATENKKLNTLLAKQDKERIVEVQVAGAEATAAELGQIGQIEETDLDAIAKRLAATQDFHDAKLAMMQEEFEIQKQIALDTFQLQADAVGALANLAGQDTVLGRLLAVAQATMNTHIGITQALTAPTMAQRIAGIVFATATGLAAVRDINSTPIPEVRINTSTPFGDGGMIGGRLHASGGTWINAERGEGVINRRSMAIPWVKRQASFLNTLGGGIPFMQHGGVVPEGLGASRFINLERALGTGRTVLITSDLHAVETNEAVVEVATTL